jgi:RNA recognition motif-containing protein
MKILVRNLARSSKEADITTLFAEYGTVASCDLVLDDKIGISKGFAFVVMPNDAEAKNAITNLNQSDFDGKRIRVKKTKTDTGR